MSWLHRCGVQMRIVPFVAMHSVERIARRASCAGPGLRWRPSVLRCLRTLAQAARRAPERDSRGTVDALHVLRFSRRAEWSEAQLVILHLSVPTVSASAGTCSLFRCGHSQKLVKFSRGGAGAFCYWILFVLHLP